MTSQQDNTYAYAKSDLWRRLLRIKRKDMQSGDPQGLEEFRGVHRHRGAAACGDLKTGAGRSVPPTGAVSHLSAAAVINPPSPLIVSSVNDRPLSGVGLSGQCH
jgi:hypothetical protein